MQRTCWANSAKRHTINVFASAGANRSQHIMNTRDFAFALPSKCPPPPLGRMVGKVRQRLLNCVRACLESSRHLGQWPLAERARTTRQVRTSNGRPVGAVYVPWRSPYIPISFVGRRSLVTLSHTCCQICSVLGERAPGASARLSHFSGRQARWNAVTYTRVESHAWRQRERVERAGG